MATKGSGTNSVMPPVRACRSRMRSRWRAQWMGRSTWPNMMVAVVLRPTPWAVSMTSSHSRVLTLSGQRMARTSSSSTSAAVPGREPRPASLRRRRKSATDRPQGGGGLGVLQGREGVDMHVRAGRLDGVADVQVGLAGVVRVNAPLHAHLGAAPLPGLDGAAGDLGLFQVVGLAPQVLAGLALGEGAELALVGAEIGVVDIAGHHVADPVAAQRPAHPVGGGADVGKVVTPGLEQARHPGLVETLATAGAGHQF